MTKQTTSQRAVWASAIALAMAIPFAAPAQEPADKAALLAQLDASLPGTLINDPTSLDWPASGDGLKVTALVDEAIPGGGAAAHYNIRKAGANPWDVQANAPITADLAVGDVVTYGFWARSTSAKTDDGKAIVGVRIQKNAAPYPGIAESSFAVDGEWRWYEASGTSAFSASSDQLALTFQLGAARQELEIGQAIVVKGAERILGDGARPAPPLPPQMQGKGALISQPDTREWTFFGPETSHAAREDKTIYLGQAIRVSSPTASQQAWDIHANVPLVGEIKSGDRLEIGVAAKTVSAATADGKALIHLRVQMKEAPYTAFSENSFAVGPNWQLVRIKTTATMDLPAGSGIVTLHFAGAEQVVDVGPTYVVRLDPEAE